MKRPLAPGGEPVDQGLAQKLEARHVRRVMAELQARFAALSRVGGSEPTKTRVPPAQMAKSIREAALSTLAGARAEITQLETSAALEGQNGDHRSRYRAALDRMHAAATELQWVNHHFPELPAKIAMLRRRAGLGRGTFLSQPPASRADLKAALGRFDDDIELLGLDPDRSASVKILVAEALEYGAELERSRPLPDELIEMLERSARTEAGSIEGALRRTEQSQSADALAAAAKLEAGLEFVRTVLYPALSEELDRVEAVDLIDKLNELFGPCPSGQVSVPDMEQAPPFPNFIGGQRLAQITQWARAWSPRPQAKRMSQKGFMNKIGMRSL